MKQNWYGPRAHTMLVQHILAYFFPNWLSSLNLAPQPGWLVEKLIAGGVAAIVTVQGGTRDQVSPDLLRSGGPITRRTVWHHMKTKQKPKSEAKSMSCGGRGRRQLR